MAARDGSLQWRRNEIEIVFSVSLFSLFSLSHARSFNSTSHRCSLSFVPREFSSCSRWLSAPRAHTTFFIAYIFNSFQTQNWNFEPSALFFAQLAKSIFSHLFDVNTPRGRWSSQRDINLTERSWFLRCCVHTSINGSFECGQIGAIRFHLVWTCSNRVRHKVGKRVRILSSRMSRNSIVTRLYDFIFSLSQEKKKILCVV